MISLRLLLVELILTYPISGERLVCFGLILNILRRVGGNIWVKWGRVRSLWLQPY